MRTRKSGAIIGGFMDLSFANPAGFWALLGLPVVLAIHFLQRRSRLLPVTTLFLLEQMRRESETGHRFERLRSSIPLWLQLLMVLLLTWLLVGPRWLRKDTVQRLAVVLDASASMQAFREKAVSELTSQLGVLARAAGGTEYTILTSEPEMPAIYHGVVREDALASTVNWLPVLGSHDPIPALRTARSLVGDGIVMFVTDHVPATAMAFDTKVLAVGEPKENCGFAGVSVEEVEGEMIFQVMVKNHGRQKQVRRWWIESAQNKTEPASIDLGAGQAHVLRAAFPTGTDECTLVLEPDVLVVDDRLPLVRPLAKSLSLSVAADASPGHAKALREVFSAFPHLQSAATRDTADLVVAIYDPLAPALPGANACVFSTDPQPGASYVAGSLLAEPDPLMDRLNWQGLLVRETLGIPRARDDRVLLWQGERPLIMLRGREGKQQQLFNFDLQTSNARRLPSFAVLVHRFLESLRREKIAPESANFETGQPLRVAHRTDTDAAPLEMVREWSSNPKAAIRIDEALQPRPSGSPEGLSISLRSVPQSVLLRAPREPDFFTVRQGEVVLLRAAAHFADPRESDLGKAGSTNELDGVASTLIERHSVADSQWRVWALVVLAALLASWWFAGQRRTRGVAGFAEAGSSNINLQESPT